MSAKIKLRCPHCGRVMSECDREKHAPPNAVLLETGCPRCVEGGFDDPHYFDSDGKEILVDPATLSTAPRADSGGDSTEPKGS